jgi:hypothetical protein
MLMNRTSRHFGGTLPLVQTILRRPATSFDAFAERHAAIFRGEQPEPKT